ncbi:MAG: thioredoxin domain-containing protein [Myxococcota bacterium]
MSVSRARRPNRLLSFILLLIAACAPGSDKPAGEAGDRGEPIARLGDQSIYRDDVAPAVAYQVYQHEVDIYLLLKAQTEALIADRVLALEAERRGMTVEALLAREVNDKVSAATGADVDAYLAEHPREAVGGEEGRSRVAYFLTATRREEKKLALLKDLRARAGYTFLLAPPEAPRTRVDVEGAPARGPADAPVTLVHFATFTSKTSVASNDYIQRLVETFPNKIRQVYRNFPNPRNETGLLAAELAAAAQEAGVFWEAHDRLFAREAQLDEKNMLEIAREIGVPEEALRQIGIDARYLKAVKRDIDAGLKAGVRREPVIYVNGRYFSGTFPYARLRQLVAEELGVVAPMIAPPETGAGPLPGG